MKKPTTKIRDEIAKLEEQLKVAEKRDAERIGRLALKVGLGAIEIDETELQTALEEVANRFRGGKGGSNGKDRAGAVGTVSAPTAALLPSAASGNVGEV